MKSIITKDLARQVVDAYFLCRNKEEVRRRFHLSAGYGVDRALFLMGHANYCSKTFLKRSEGKRKSPKVVHTLASKDISFEEWMKINTDFTLELMSRSERCLKAEAHAAECEEKLLQTEAINKELSEKVKTQGDVIQRLGHQLRVSDEQKLRWEVIAKGGMAEAGH